MSQIPKAVVASAPSVISLNSRRSMITKRSLETSSSLAA
jgi:hypothetical protein